MGRPSSQLLDSRWRSGRYIGAHKPIWIVEVQRGVIDRHYAPFEMLDGSSEDFGTIQGSKHNADPWHAYWRPTGPWKEVPNVTNVDTEQGFDNNGIANCTITIENTILKLMLGMAGTYHLIERGHMAPWFGWATWGRPETQQQLNEWWEVFNGGYQVKVWEGYGDDAREPSFAGLIDDCKLGATPATIQIVCRDFGQSLTEHRIFGWNKARELPSPIVFAPRSKVYKTEKKGGSASASSEASGHPASRVTRADDTYWLSGGENGAIGFEWTEWTQIRVPKGTYESIYVYPHYAGMEMYISVFARNAKVDGVPVDDGFIFRGLGNVPGDNGGHPYVKLVENAAKEGKRYKLGFKLEAGDDTVIRVSFRDLQYSPGRGGFRAGVRRLVAFREKIIKSEQKKKQILIEDYSDMVKWAFMWAGFHEWVVEPTGVPMKNPVTFNQGQFLIDIVEHVKQQGDFVFFMDRPTDNPSSIGVPIFRRTKAMDPPAPSMLEVTEDQLLTSVSPSFSKEPLNYIIRARGRMPKKGEGKGVRLGEDRVRRFQATYMPPWSGAHRNVATGLYDTDYPFADRMAGLRKHQQWTDDNLESNDECMMAAILAAMKSALAAFTCSVEIPGRPDIGLGDQISVIDSATGMNGRIFIGSRHTTNGADGYVTSLSGSMIDTPDVLALAGDYMLFLDRVKKSYRV